MSTTDTATETATDTDTTASSATTARWLRFLPATSMLVIVLIGSLLPLLKNPNFYYWDDTAAVAVGVWQRIPAALLSGELPFLQLDMWRGGNLIAEAATGMWNPVMVALMLITHPIDSLPIAIGICKIALFLIAALGVYRLARGYGANRWMAALAGTALPLSGWALFIDGTAWINGSAITAFTPWAWWALRRAMLKGWTPWSIVVAVVFGYLLTSVGNPYGLLTILIAYIAVAVEMVFTGRARSLWWLVGTGAVTLAMSVVVYLPFLLTSSVGFRANSGIFNDEFLAVSVSNLLGMSTPSYLPYIKMFGLREILTPAMYLSWIVLPALPWLKWRMPRPELKALSSALVFGGFFLLLVLGPSQFLMFRWPARLIPFLYLAVIVVFAVLASRGLATDRRATRSLASVGIILLGTWLAASDMPRTWEWHVAGTVGVVILGALVLWRMRDAAWRTFVVFAIGTVGFLGMQIIESPGNINVADYNPPTSKATLQDGVGERYQGVTVQVANPMGAQFDRSPDGSWQDMLIGTQFAIAGVDATNSYSGIGYNALDSAMCMTYNGSTCPALWDALWQEPEGADATLADLLGAQTVVVQAGFVADPQTPDGWRVDEVTDFATVYVRESPALDGGRASWSEGVQITSDEMVGTTGESVGIESDGDAGRLVFARLAWPGYSATLDGQPLTVGPGPAGLLQVDVPAGTSTGQVELRFTPPGLTAGLIGIGLGLVGLFALVLLSRRAHRS